MKKPAPKTDDEWADAIADEDVEQIIETPDADALAGKWPPLVESVTGEDADKRIGATDVFTMPRRAACVRHLQ